MKVVDFLFSCFSRRLTIQSYVLSLQALKMIIQLIHYNLMMGKYNNLNVILQNRRNILFYRLYLCQSRKNVASHYGVVFILLWFLCKHVNKLLTIANILNWNWTSQKLFDFSYHWFLGLHNNDLPLFWWQLR